MNCALTENLTTLGVAARFIASSMLRNIHLLAAVKAICHLAVTSR